MELETILSDERLDTKDRAALAQALLSKATEERKLELEEQRFERETRSRRWSTPLAIALTGLITIGANFAVDWLKAERAGEQAITLTELEGAISGALDADKDTRAAIAAERSFQYEIMRSELSRFNEDHPEANLKRAQSLLFLVRAGLLEGLEVQYLGEIAERTITNAGGTVESQGVPSLRNPEHVSGRQGRALLRAISQQDLTGYDPGFLSHRIDLPSHSQDNVWLDYGSYSILMDKVRPYARMAAHHIDGPTHHVVRRGGTWLVDPRVSSDRQLSSDSYARNSFDRGNLVRRTDITWGSEAQRTVASRGSFFLTNATPQHKRFNQRTWLGVEDYVLRAVVDKKLRASVFAGPLFGPDDPIFKGVPVPVAFWKIVIAEDEQGHFLVGAFLADQIEQLKAMTEEGLAGFTPGSLPDLRPSKGASPMSPPAVHGVDPFALMQLIGVVIDLPSEFEAL